MDGLIIYTIVVSWLVMGGVAMALAMIQTGDKDREKLAVFFFFFALIAAPFMLGIALAFMRNPFSDKSVSPNINQE